MGEIIDLDREKLTPIKEAEFRQLLKEKGSKSWRVGWAISTEGDILMTALLGDHHYIGYVTSAFRREID